MKIVLVAHGYPPEVVGGTERYVERVATSLARGGHEVSVFSGSLEWRPTLSIEEREQDGVFVRRIHREDLYFDRWDKGYHPGVSAAFGAFLEEARPDVVHVHHWIRLSVDLIHQAAMQGIPAVATLHDLYPSCPRVFRLKDDQGEVACVEPMGPGPCVPCVPRWRFDGDEEIARRVEVYREDMRRELGLARRLIAPTAGHATFLAQALGVEFPQVMALPHGTLSSASLVEARPGAQGDRVQVVCWSHLHPLKGQHVLLEAARLATSRDRLRIHLLGGPVDEAYKARLDRLAEGLDVVFHGGFDPDDLQTVPMDVAVLPTLCRESYSFILDEAARLGAPILASDAGALQDRATQRVQLFARGDAADLARALDQIVVDGALRARMRAAPGPELLPFDDHVARLIEVYRVAVDDGAPAVPPAQDRALEEWRRRESYFRELVRIERWEDVVEELKARIRELEQRGPAG